MALRSPSPDFLRCLSPDSSEKIRVRRATRIASLHTHQQLISDANDEYREIDSSVYVNTRYGVIDSQIHEYTEYLDALSGYDETKLPGVQETRRRYIERLTPLIDERNVLKRSMRSVQEDVRDEIKVSKRRRPNPIAIDPSITEEAYATTLSQRFYAAAMQKKSKFDQSQFKKDVVTYYGAAVEGSNQDIIYCHLTGLWGRSDVKAAHIIPESLGDREVGHLFGSDESQARDSPRNSLLLHKNIEEAMNSGRVAMVPLHSNDDEPTKWKCILVDESIGDNMIAHRVTDPVERIYFRDIDNKELKFRSDNRPARRFLYCRFIMSLIHAKEDDNTMIITRVMEESGVRELWPSSGQYLRKSTLMVITRRISGLELPEAIMSTTTFEEGEAEPDEEDKNVDCTIKIRNAIKRS